jgi:rare lipoprotein A
MNKIFSVLIILSILLLSCNPSNRFSSKSTDPPVSKGETIVGYATYYGPGFHGNKTANGEIFDMYKMTCAHRTLPFGTVLHVTNLSNNKSVQVRVNDRGPFVKGVILDLSYGAAKKIGLDGKEKVEIKIVK